MKNIFGDYFYFTSTERKVTIVILCAVVFFRLLPLTFPFLFQRNESFFFPEMPKFNLSHQAHQTKLAEDKEIREFPFNPNLASREDLSNLGLSEKIVNTIYNFRNKGGKFYKVEDFQKIWGLSSNEFQRLAPYIVIENNNNYYPTTTTNEINSTASNTIDLFPFSPNLASIEDLTKLGIPIKVAQRIVNYRSKGGIFRKKEDLQKIYGFPADLYTKLEPFINLENSVASATTQPSQNQAIEQNQATTTFSNQNYNIPSQIPGAYNNGATNTTYTSKKTFSGVVDINQSNAEQWQQLPGIGAGYANKIVNFREKLGGFYSVEQIKETYGLPDSTFQKIKIHLKASPILRTININNVTQEELSRHPYCKTNHAKLIINYRDTHGKYANIEALRKVYGIQDILPKLQSYISY